MKVRDVMTTTVSTTTPDASLREAATELARLGVSGMPVVGAQGQVVGVISEADILVKEGDEHHVGSFLHWLVDPEDPGLVKRFEATRVADAMSTPPVTITPERPVTEVANHMIDRHVNRLPVVDEAGSLVGIVSRADLVRAFTRTDEEIRQEIERDVVGRILWIEASGLVVDVTDGAVRLTGTVPTKSDAELLPKLVRRVPGVVSVSATVKSAEH